MTCNNPTCSKCVPLPKYKIYDYVGAYRRKDDGKICPLIEWLPDGQNYFAILWGEDKQYWKLYDNGYTQRRFYQFYERIN